MRKLYLIFLFAFSIASLNAQNVGIGTSSPSRKLDVEGDMILSGASGRSLFAENAFNIRGTSGIDIIIDDDNNSTNSPSQNN